jgi:hypothetical protein
MWRETPARTPKHQTTINFYCGLETTQANQEFGKIIRHQIRQDHSQADQAEDEEA